VIIADGGFGTWQARIPEPDGEIVITRYRLVELLYSLNNASRVAGLACRSRSRTLQER
jgi:hypothetical protein